MPTKKKPWTPDRIRRLIERSGAGHHAEFGAMIGVSRQLVSNWLNGWNVPKGVHAFALDCLSEKLEANLVETSC